MLAFDQTASQRRFSFGAEMNKKTRSPQLGAEQKKLVIDAMLAYEGRGQTSRERDRQGRFCTSGLGPGRPSLNSIVRALAAEYAVGETTIWNWRRQYRLGGYGALIRKRRADRGRSNYFFKRPALGRLVQSSLAVGSTAFSLSRALRALLGSHAPSYDTLRSYAQHQRSSASSAQRSAGSAATQ